ncbi:hypothetical protein COUCH_22315 [Couchioplanes caeruleus]|uniref:hypothetical protein n=1 Tax=Couchioplanes caeruleus TaxID=56438 RepID=UPI0020BDF371|nr:hypothetical protein [Couchioplanes caeruleus]UQU61775.1 hypothetical protein COUCH_22315 [Couchioplanes caeruleus]
MLLILVLTAALVGACAYTVWPHEAAAGVEPAGAAPAREPVTLEGALVTQLVAGEISRPQYMRAMEKLAARDDARHPLAVPPDNGPAAAGA